MFGSKGNVRGGGVRASSSASGKLDSEKTPPHGILFDNETMIKMYTRGEFQFSTKWKYFRAKMHNGAEKRAVVVRTMDDDDLCILLLDENGKCNHLMMPMLGPDKGEKIVVYNSKLEYHTEQMFIQHTLINNGQGGLLKSLLLSAKSSGYTMNNLLNDRSIELAYGKIMREKKREAKEREAKEPRVVKSSSSVDAGSEPAAPPPICIAQEIVDNIFFCKQDEYRALRKYFNSTKQTER